MNRTLGTAGALGLGAWLMYLLDPDRGRRRRALVRDRAVRLLNLAEEGLDKAGRDLAHRATGLAAGVRTRFASTDVPDYVLVERVRAKMGRYVSHPSSIEVTARAGRITLSGPILARELEGLLSAVAGVPGVWDVENRLEPHREPGDVPGLQGGAARPGARAELRQANWAPATRLLAALSGGSLAVWGRRRGGIAGAALAVLGLTALARGLTNVPIKRLAGAGGRRAIDLQKTIEVPAPVEEVFALWTNLENLPRFMAHVREVRKTGDGRSHWIAAGPGGIPVEWDADITELAPNELIAWRSVPGSAVGSAGRVLFERTPEDGTRLTIRMSYNPPAGALGHAVASLFGADPKRALDEDLLRLKSLFVEGRTTAHGREVRRGWLPQEGGGPAGSPGQTGGTYARQGGWTGTPQEPPDRPGEGPGL